MSLVSLLKGSRGASGFGFASTAEDVTQGLDLGGKTYLVTGVASGLGLETARVLAARGATIVGAARTKEKVNEACAALVPRIVPVACDLAEPPSVRACVAEVLDKGTPLDGIICNAGIMALPKRTIAHGQELQFLTNHIGHFILVTGLLSALTDRARVVVLSSAAHAWSPPSGIDFDDLTLEKSYSPNRAYGQSKLANLLFARGLSRRFSGTEKTANAVHPGVIHTNLGRHMNPVVQALAPVVSAIALKSIPQGAATQCYVAVHPSVANVSGEYFADCNIAKSSRHGRDDSLAELLYQRTEEIVRDLERSS